MGLFSFLDKLLEIGATFDYVTPAVGALSDFNPRDATFYLVDSAGLTGLQVEKLLKHNGIRVKAMMFLEDDLAFSVSKRDKAAVEKILRQHRLVLL